MVGAPVRQSLSPLIHNAWIAAAGLDAVYVPFSPALDAFAAFVAGLKGGSLAGLNVTLPFKAAALAAADVADDAAVAAGAANLLLFRGDGQVEARNTDGIGLLHALNLQAPGWSDPDGPAVVLGAGGAARGAAAALTAASAQVQVVNRTHARAVALAEHLPGVEAVEMEQAPERLRGASLVVNATAAGLEGEGRFELPFHLLSPGAVVMDMVYKPLRTPFLRQAEAQGLRTVDGLAMLIGQAAPSFEALFGRPPPANVDVRALALAALGEAEA